MRLTEIDWNAPGGAADVQYEYPDDLIAPFVNWLRRSQRWMDDQHAVEEKLRNLNGRLRDYRERQGAVLIESLRPAVVTAEMPVAEPDAPVAATDRFAAARAALAEKRRLAAAPA